jgi:hypothetical protein
MQHRFRERKLGESPSHLIRHLAMDGLPGMETYGSIPIEALGQARVPPAVSTSRTSTTNVPLANPDHVITSATLIKNAPRACAASITSNANFAIKTQLAPGRFRVSDRQPRLVTLDCCQPPHISSTCRPLRYARKHTGRPSRRESVRTRMLLSEMHG